MESDNNDGSQVHLLAEVGLQVKQPVGYIKYKNYVAKPTYSKKFSNLINKVNFKRKCAKLRKES